MIWELLRDVPEADLQRLLALARPRRFEAGEVVFHRDDPADSLHLIRSGRFAVKVLTPRGDVAVLAVLAPGDVFGELALLAGDGRRSATVVALEAGRTHAVHQEDFARLRRAHPQVTEILIAVLAGQVRRLSGQVVQALYVSADDRVLARLAEVARHYPSHDGEVVVPLTQEDLAGLAGTSRATVNRVLRAAQHRGVIDLGRGRVRVRDVNRLTSRSAS